MQRTPLHYAAMKDHSEIVRYLVEQGANVDVKDKSEVRMISEPWHASYFKVMWPKCMSPYMHKQAAAKGICPPSHQKKHFFKLGALEIIFSTKMPYLVNTWQAGCTCPHCAVVIAY